MQCPHRIHIKTKKDCVYVECDTDRLFSLSLTLLEYTPLRLKEGYYKLHLVITNLTLKNLSILMKLQDYIYHGNFCFASEKWSGGCLNISRVFYGG